MWDLNARSFRLLNEAAMILLRKNDAPSGLRDYRPICLIHSVGKLFSKVLVMRLAPRMTEIVKDNQTTFIKGRKHYRRQLFCRVSQTLGKGRYILGKAFAECTLGKGRSVNSLSAKTSLSSALYQALGKAFAEC